MVLTSMPLGRRKGYEVWSLGAERSGPGTGTSPAWLRRLSTWNETRPRAYEHSSWKCHASKKLAKQVGFVVSGERMRLRETRTTDQPPS